MKTIYENPFECTTCGLKNSNASFLVLNNTAQLCGACAIQYMRAVETLDGWIDSDEEDIPVLNTTVRMLRES
jgi:hypothetical protein